MQKHPVYSFGQSRNRLTPRVYIPILLGLFSMVMSLAAVLFLRDDKVMAENSAAKVPVTVTVQQPVGRVEVLVPRVEIPTGALLAPNLFETTSVPENEVVRNAVHSPLEIQGFYARALLVPGQPVTRDYLTPVKPASEVIGAIPEGYRAVSIRVDERTSVEGWARAGARVDIVWSSRVNGNPVISVIVENAKILSAERQVNPQPEKQDNKPVPIPTTVTLLVPTDDANRIQLATVSGSMSLSLRGLNDNKSNKSVPLSIEDLLSRGRPIAEPNKPRVVLSVKGTGGARTGYTLHDGQLIPVVE